MHIRAARRRRSLFTFKRGRGLRRSENKMTTPTTTRKICAFFFTGLDRSHLTNLDRSTFEKERNQCFFVRCFGSLHRNAMGKKTTPLQCQIQIQNAHCNVSDNEACHIITKNQHDNTVLFAE